MLKKKITLPKRVILGTGILLGVLIADRIRKNNVIEITTETIEEEKVEES